MEEAKDWLRKVGPKGVGKMWDFLNDDDFSEGKIELGWETQIMCNFATIGFVHVLLTMLEQEAEENQG